MDNKYTFILGIDVASEKLDLCLFDVNKQESTFTAIDYTEKALESYLKKNKKNIKSQLCLMGLESTGDYHLKAARFFLEKGFQVKVINPILTKQYTRTTIRGTKTDKTDSELICKLVLDNYGALVKLAGLTDEGKELLRLSHSLTKIATQLKLRLQSTKRKSLANTEDIAKKMESLIKDISQLSEQTVKQATQVRTREEEFIDSIPGFATKLSAVVYHEIGDIQRFKSSKALVAYAGLDPRIRQSGNKLSTNGRITKRGSKYLRSALFLAANVARRYDADLEAYYQKKKNENRTHKEILCMISRKLLARIYSVLKEKRYYVPSPIGVKS